MKKIATYGLRDKISGQVELSLCDTPEQAWSFVHQSNQARWDVVKIEMKEVVTPMIPKTVWVPAE